MTGYLGRLIQRAWGAEAANERLTPAPSRWQSAAPELGGGPFETGAETTSTSAAAKQPAWGTRGPLTQRQTDSDRQVRSDDLGTRDYRPFPALAGNDLLSPRLTAASLDDQQGRVSGSAGPAAVNPKPTPAEVRAEGLSAALFPPAPSEVHPIGTAVSDQGARDTLSDLRTAPSQRQAVPHEPSDSFRAGPPVVEPSARQPSEAQPLEPVPSANRPPSASPLLPQGQDTMHRNGMKGMSAKTAVPNQSRHFAHDSPISGIERFVMFA